MSIYSAAERIEGQLNDWRKSIIQIEACLMDCPWWAASRRKSYERNKDVYEAYALALEMSLSIVRSELPRRPSNAR